MAVASGRDEPLTSGTGLHLAGRPYSDAFYGWLAAVLPLWTGKGTSMTVPKVETTYVSGDRWYVDPGTGEKVPGVSAILNMMPKPALTKWAAREAASFAVSNIDVVAALARSDEKAAVELVKGAPWRKSGKAADSGTEVHGLAEQLMRDRIEKRKSTFRVPQGTMDFLKNFARFATEFNVYPHLIETTVWDDEYDYAGTFDGLYTLTLDGREILAIVDIKTGASGVWPEAALQQTAYARAKWYLDPATGERRPMPQVDAAFGLWLRPEGWALIPLEIDDVNWEQFKRLRASYEWKLFHEKHAVGKAVNKTPLTRKWKGNQS